MKGQRDRKDYIDLTGLPNRALVKKARKIIAQIKSGVHYQDLGGKKIKCSKNVVSIPYLEDTGYFVLTRRPTNCQGCFHTRITTNLILPAWMYSSMVDLLHFYSVTQKFLGDINPV